MSEALNEAVKAYDDPMRASGTNIGYRALKVEGFEAGWDAAATHKDSLSVGETRMNSGASIKDSVQRISIDLLAIAEAQAVKAVDLLATAVAEVARLTNESDQRRVRVRELLLERDHLVRSLQAVNAVVAASVLDGVVSVLATDRAEGSTFERIFGPAEADRASRHIEGWLKKRADEYRAQTRESAAQSLALKAQSDFYAANPMDEGVGE
ncbi:hypothetical protein D6T64_11920 [Cryobacterium melibiosiphilum]|uniref:Uncharacterized protein n=1 Tax=Cryobacterium melibiosiphilum TaxID=995039 RepID=A0A3A5MD92_9MICO|nr:hypothetical protein [Cryobacterium melibiosiphilum]RJT88090.1 hypothetical protein D6T64_11920 [Cryobacterium melibiosiphilum]